MAEPALYINKNTWVSKGTTDGSAYNRKMYHNVKEDSYSVKNCLDTGSGSSVSASTIKKVNVRISTQVIMKGSAKIVPLDEQPVFCWKKNGDEWQPTALLHTDDCGILRYVDVNYQGNVKKQLYELYVKRRIVKGVRKRNTTLFSKTGFIPDLPVFYEFLRPCKFDPGAQYFFIILPVNELLRHKRSLLKEEVNWKKRQQNVYVDDQPLSINGKADALPEKLLNLIKNPPEPKWCEGAFDNILTEDIQNEQFSFKGGAGTLCRIPSDGRVWVPYNMSCFIGDLANNVSFMEREAGNLHNYISHQEKVSSLFYSLINFLILNRGAIENNNQMREWQKKIHNHICYLFHFKNNVEQAYSDLFSETEKEKATALYHGVCDRIAGWLENIFLNPVFQQQLKRVEKNGLGSVPCLDWFDENVPSKIICEAISAIGMHSDETCRSDFYKRFLLPFFLELAFRLEEKDLDFLSAQVSPSELKKSMPFLSDDDIQAYSAEIKSFLNKKALTVEEKCDIRIRLQIYGSESISVLNSLFESDHLNIAPFFHLVFDSFETMVNHYTDTHDKLLLSMILLRSGFAAMKHIAETDISPDESSKRQKSPGEKRYQIRYDQLLSKTSSAAAKINSSKSAGFHHKPYIGLLSSTLGMIDSFVVMHKYGQKEEFTWEDKRNMALAAMNLTSDSISFINFFAKVFREDITKGFLAPASFVFAAMKGKDSIRDALNEKDYPAVALHSYSMASSGLKSTEAMFRMMHRFKVAHIRNKLGLQAAKQVFTKGFLWSRFFT
ncbi:MAG: hypothetical protein ACLFQB_16235, partial [Chitinispirillaceae bacterium]